MFCVKTIKISEKQIKHAQSKLSFNSKYEFKKSNQIVIKILIITDISPERKVYIGWVWTQTQNQNQLRI